MLAVSSLATYGILLAGLAQDKQNKRKIFIFFNYEDISYLVLLFFKYFQSFNMFFLLFISKVIYFLDKSKKVTSNIMILQILENIYYLKSPSFVRTNDYKPIEFQEKLIISQLEAKHALFVNSLKYERSTTSRLLKNLIVLPRVIGVLNSFLIVPFLRIIYI